MAFELIPHPSDMGVRGMGSTVEEAFSEAARAMFSLMADLGKIEPREAVPVEVEAGSLEDLFVRFLGELLFLRDTRGMLFSQFVLQITNEGGLLRASGEAWGEKFSPAKHRVGIDVKAATYNWVKVAREEGAWVAQGVVDV